MILMRASTERSSTRKLVFPKPPNLGRFWLAKKRKGPLRWRLPSLLCNPRKRLHSIEHTYCSGTGGCDETLYALIEEEVLDERVLTCDAAIETAVALTRSRPRCSAWRRGAAYGNSLAKLLASLCLIESHTPPVPASLSFSRA